MARILIVEDEASMRRILGVLLARDGHETKEADSRAKAEKELAGQRFDLVLTDQNLPDGNGLQVLKLCSEVDATLPVIMITAYATVDLAVETMRKGAFDFISKPFQPETVLAAVDRACNHGALLRENLRLRQEVDRLEFGHTDLLGTSPKMQEVRELIARAAPTDVTVLISGETGTGKELVARAIHRNSVRASKPFIAVNCAALPEPLLESQLFGHERGAFTGADRARQGLFEAAHGGTLFLDEAGEMPPSLQVKLLRVLVGGEVLRVGATTARHVDVRVLAATHRNLRARVAEQLFREDLYYRLAVVPVHMPALRERAGDIPELVEFFLDVVASDLKVPRRNMDSSALERLMRYPFPGNVRELRNLIERAYILGRGANISLEDLPLDLGHGATDVGDPQESAVSIQPLGTLDLRAALEEVESEFILRALAESGGNQAEAARRLGISRSDMNYKIKKLGLKDRPSAQPFSG